MLLTDDCCRTWHNFTRLELDFLSIGLELPALLDSSLSLWILAVFVFCFFPEFHTACEEVALELRTGIKSVFSDTKKVIHVIQFLSSGLDYCVVPEQSDSCSTSGFSHSASDTSSQVKTSWIQSDVSSVSFYYHYNKPNIWPLNLLADNLKGPVCQIQPDECPSPTPPFLSVRCPSDSIVYLQVLPFHFFLIFLIYTSTFISYTIYIACPAAVTQTFPHLRINKVLSYLLRYHISVGWIYFLFTFYYYYYYYYSLLS